MQAPFAPLDPPVRVLLGPGPSDVAPSVLRALSLPTLGHLDPRFLAIMDEIRAMLRSAFQTQSELCFPMSGTGSAGMETCFVNLLEPGDRALVGVNGVFGGRMCDVAARAGAEVVRVEGPWGRALGCDDFRRAAAGRAFKVLAVVHAETSTGVRQDLAGFRELADELGAFLLVDAVTSLAGIPVEMDAWGIDAIYSGTQKCLSCPPGLAPIGFSERARAALSTRRKPVQSWYLDLTMISAYWGAERAYHHTAPIQMLYGLHEALRLALAEGLEARFERHRRHGRALVAGLAELGLEPLVPEAERLPQLTAVKIPPGVDDAAIRRELLSVYGIEIGGGLGPLKGKLWRIGLMGEAASARNVVLLLTALADALRRAGCAPRAGDPVGAARAELG